MVHRTQDNKDARVNMIKNVTNKRDKYFAI